MTHQKYWVKKKHLCQFHVHSWHFRASALWSWETLHHQHVFLLQKWAGASLYVINWAVLPSCLDSALAVRSPAAGGDAASRQLWPRSPLLPLPTQHTFRCGGFKEPNSTEEPHVPPSSQRDLPSHFAQRGSGGPIPGKVQGQVGWSSEQHHPVKDVPAHCRGVGLDGL